MIDGVGMCVPEPTELTTCWAMGDPHHRTFDGQRFDFMGTCTYVMAKNCGARGLPAFEVLAQNENRGNRKVSYVGLVVVTVYNTTISAVRSETGYVRGHPRCASVFERSGRDGVPAGLEPQSAQTPQRIELRSVEEVQEAKFPV
uniref:VWFD domain-containing protein n=1 Tax=Knipowitschia caucasica TaxID=637954 RepID=A0AAV2MDB8_KNICA